MRISTKAWINTIVATTVTLGTFALTAQAKADSYNATFYVAGMGGHFAKAVCEIDPAKAQPITIKELTKIEIGTNATHPVHDARIDNKDGNTMFWSTYKVDKATGGMHVGKTDLKSGKTTADLTVKLPAEATETGSIYCASGQSEKFYLPISMTNKAFIDVFQKSDLKQTQRIFLEGTDGDIGKPYKFFHGTNSPDMKTLLLTVNEADKPQGKTIGKMHLLALDMDAAIDGKVKVVKKGLATGAEGSFLSFRQYYSNDGKLIANSAGDSMLLIDANSLEVLDHEPMANLEENHDAMFTPDGKYVIATTRTKVVSPNCKTPEKPGPDEFVMDGTLRLYDVAAKKFVGESASVCGTCHKDEGVTQHAVLCGLDATWNK